MAASRSRRRARRSWAQRLLIIVNINVVLGCLTAAAGLAWFREEFAGVQRIAFSQGALSEQRTESQPMNILLVGVDRAAGLEDDDPVLIGRNQKSLLTDTMMVLRIVPDEQRAALLSIPRDLWVPLAGLDRNGRINSAMAYGGPETLIRTIREYLGIPIHHYMEVDFLGFEKMVAAVDGVPVYFDKPMRDGNTGLHVLETGCVNLDPVQALSYVRSRHAQFMVDGRWKSDPTSDFGRVERQQEFVRLAMRRAIAKGFRNPVVLRQLINVGQQNVKFDTQLTLGAIVDLALQFRSFDPDDLETYTLPTSSAMKGAAAVLELREEEAQDTLDVFRGTRGVAAFSAVRVAVRNGSGAPGQATDVGAALAELGYTVTSRGDADRFDVARTTIRYRPGLEQGAVFLARFISSEVVYERADALGDADLELLTGKDFGAILPADQVRPDAEFRPALDALLGATTTTDGVGASSTTTTSLGATTTTEDPAIVAARASCG